MTFTESGSPHQQVANYARTAAIVIKPFVDHYEYPKSSVFTADETYIKVRGIKGYIWFIMDAASRSILGYQVSDNRSVGPCIPRHAHGFPGHKKTPRSFGSLPTAIVLILWPPSSS